MVVRLPLTVHRWQCLRAVEESGELSPAEVADVVMGLPRNSVYNMLKRFEDEGMVSSRIKKIRGERNRPRRLYKLTEHGVALLEAHRLCVKAMSDGLERV